MRGKKVCRIHGGLTPEGIASPHFKNGEHSKLLKHLPPSLAPHFNPDNPRLIELREELALVDAGMIELLEQLKFTSPPKWKDAVTAFDAFAKAKEARDAKGMNTHLEVLDALLHRGARALGAQQQVMGLIDRRARLVMAESRRRKDEHEMASLDEFGRFARLIVEAVEKHVPDRKVLGLVQADVLRVLAISQVSTVGDGS